MTIMENLSLSSGTGLNSSEISCANYECSSEFVNVTEYSFRKMLLRSLAQVQLLEWAIKS